MPTFRCPTPSFDAPAVAILRASAHDLKVTRAALKCVSPFAGTGSLSSSAIPRRIPLSGALPKLF
eukprot:m.622137 g.622137  ORF g.622137 m.622137 type:complete len:65 (-) comp58217_c0_seq6:46-240(-)